MAKPKKPESMSSPGIAQPSKAEGERDYEAESAADNIMRAHEHMQDDELMKRVDKHLNKKRKAISSIGDLRKAAKARRDELAGNEDPTDA